MLRLHTRIGRSATAGGGRGRRLWGERGAAAVEFALVLPILLVIVFGILDFGLYFYNDLQLTHAARDAVRQLSVGDAHGAEQAIDRARDNLVSVDMSGWHAPDLTDPHYAQGETVSVDLHATYDALTPLPSLLHWHSSGINIDASASMRRE